MESEEKNFDEAVFYSHPHEDTGNLQHETVFECLDACFDTLDIAVRDAGGNVDHDHTGG